MTDHDQLSKIRFDGETVDPSISHRFWQSPTLDELAQAQNAEAVTNVETLLGGWPGEVDDGFEAATEELRHQDLTGDRPQ